MGIFELIEKRERFAEVKHRALLRKVKALQAGLYASLLDNIIADLQTDADGRIRFNSDNLQRVARASVVWAAYRKKSGGLTDWIVKALVSLFGLNTKYFKEVATVSDTLEERARKLLLKNLGYDLTKKELIKDSWLSNLVAQEDVKQRVVNRINAALQAKMPLEQFRKEFRDDFLDNSKGLGYASRFFNQKTGDLFMMFDRSAQKVYAEKLNLKFWLYNGTIMHPVPGKTKGTRPFCWQRVGGLFSDDEVEKWNAETWSGKVTGVDVRIAAGGHKCRHGTSAISAELAESLQKRGRKLNEYTPLPAHLKGKK